MRIAICNQKGGVGKTAVATELAYQYAHTGARSLLVDLDPQASATNILGVSRNQDLPTIFDLLGAIPPQLGEIRAAIRTAGPMWAGLECLSAERALADTESDVTIGREMKVKRILDQIEDTYDVMIIDCPPSLGMLTAHALAAAEQSLIVSEARVESAQAISEVLTTIANVKTYYNPDLSVVGIVMNRRLKGRKDQTQWVEQIKDIYKDMVLDAEIPDREVVSAAASDGVPVAVQANGQPITEAIGYLRDLIGQTERA